MTLQLFVAGLHDVGLGISGGSVYGWQRSRQGQVQRADLVPATSRAALGLSTYDSYQIDAFLAQNTLEGGAGQGRFSAGDKYLSGLGDAWPGHYFPQRLKQTAASTGGTTTWYMVRRPIGAAAILYGMDANSINIITTATERARSAGVIGCKPVVTGSQFAFWCQGTAGARDLYSWDGNTANAPADITSRLAGAQSPDVTALYERGLWVLGTGTPTVTPAIAGSGANFAHKTFGHVTSATMSLVTESTAGNLLLLAVQVEDTGTPTALPTPEGSWLTAANDRAGDNTTWLFYRPNAPATETVTVGFSETASGVRIAVIEVEGIKQVTPMQGSNSVARTGSTDGTTPTITAVASGIAFAVLASSAATTWSTYSANWSELFDTGAASTSTMAVVYTTTAASTDDTVATAAGAGDIVSIIANFTVTTTPAGSLMFKAWRSIDEGATFEDIFATTSTGIGEPRAALATGRELYFTTSGGMLYALAAEEREFEDHQEVVNVAIRGPIDAWDVPLTNEGSGAGPDIAGKWLATYDGSLFTNVGPSVRQLPIGGVTGSGRQVWPNQEWDWMIGEVRCVITGPDGLYFSVRANASYDVLFRYNGRGFVPLLKATAGELDYMHFHLGRLYTTTNPSSYYQFKYASTRPDQAGLTVADFTTGYHVSSKIDLEKVNQWKVIGKAFTEVEWSATSASGTVTLAYYVSTNGLHPEIYLPDDESVITWTTIGTHTVADGNFKEYTIDPPIEAKAFWLRTKNEVGVSGYAKIEAYGVDGVTLMPPVDGFTLPLTISTGTRTRGATQTNLYPTMDEVVEALDLLDTLRLPSSSPRYLTLYFVNENGDYDEYTVVMERKIERITGFVHDNSMAAEVDLILREI